MGTVKPAPLSPAMHQCLGALATDTGHLDEPPGSIWPVRAAIESLGVYEATYEALLRRGLIELYTYEPTGKELARVSEAGYAALQAANERVRAQARKAMEQHDHPADGQELLAINAAQRSPRGSLNAAQWARLPYRVRLNLTAKDYFTQDGPDVHARRILTENGREAMRLHLVAVAEGSPDWMSKRAAQELKELGQ